MRKETVRSEDDLVKLRETAKLQGEIFGNGMREIGQALSRFGNAGGILKCTPLRKK